MPLPFFVQRLIAGQPARHRLSRAQHRFVTAAFRTDQQRGGQSVVVDACRESQPGQVEGIVSYDPAYGYEISYIVADGLRRMYGDQPEDISYYLTVYNEPMVQPAEPENVDVEGILKGIHLIAEGGTEGREHAPRAQLLASGVGVPWALEAQRLLADDFGVVADVWSVTSWNELYRDGVRADEHNYLHPEREPQVAYVTRKLSGRPGPVVAVSDFMRAVQDQIRGWVPSDYYTLGADGFDFSNTRRAARTKLYPRQTRAARHSF